VSEYAEKNSFIENHALELLMFFLKKVQKIKGNNDDDKNIF
jgi:hypothetical protein